MASIVSDVYIGDGGTSHQIVGVGYRPASVWIRRNGGIAAALNIAIDVGGVVYTKGAGANTATTTAVSFTSDGFTLTTTNTDLNQNGTQYLFVAFPHDSAVCETFSYVGDGTDNRSVGALSFTPVVAFSAPLNAERGPYWTSTQHSADNSQPVTLGDFAAANYIQSLVAGGIQVGTALNVSGTTYYVLCFASSAVLTLTNYNGNGTDNRNIPHLLGSVPGFVYIQARTGTARDGVMRFSAESGDESVVASGFTVPIADLIQSIDATNLNIGTDARVNAASGTPNYVVLSFATAPVGLAATGGSPGVEGAVLFGAGDFAPPGVFVHDGSGVRLGELVNAVMKRSYRTMQVSRATVVIPENDEQLPLCDPREGRILVVESTLYPYIWAGPLRNLEGGPVAGTVSLEASSYEDVLRQRFLPTEAIGTGTSGQQFEAMWRVVERENPTGVSLSNDISAGEPFDDTNYTDRSLFDAWNLAAQQTGHEWWLEHAVTNGVLTTQAQFRPQRGQDRTGDVRLVVGPYGNCRVNRWRMSTEGGGHVIKAVAGATSVTQGYTSRSRVQRRAGKAPVSTAVLTQRANTRHGYSFASWPQGDTPLTRAEQLAIMENVQGAGSLAIAAESILARGRTAQRMVDLEVQAHPEVWPLCQPGDVVTLTLPSPYFIDGIDTVAAIVDVEVTEELGTMRLNIELPAA